MTPGVMCSRAMRSQRWSSVHMLSLTKINSSRNQSRSARSGDGYLLYLGAPSTRQRGDFDDYARGDDRSGLGPPPFWACGGAAILGVGAIAEAEQVERLSRGLHPVSGEPLVQGAGDSHVMGLDMTFSAPKDFSAIFAGADAPTREALVECLHDASRAALRYAETGSITRHGQGGHAKKTAEAAIAACYTHFASRSGDPQLHVHAFMFNVGKRAGSNEWSALEQRPQFDRKMSTGALFRVELATRLRALGFSIERDGPYFKIRGITDEQRDALSTRSRQIAERVKEMGATGKAASAARDVAAVNTRAAKSEPPLPQLLVRFQRRAAELGLTPEAVARMRERDPAPAVSCALSTAAASLDIPGVDSPAQAAPFSIDHVALLDRLTESQSCATPQEALALICESAMGEWSAARCLEELDLFMKSEQVCILGETEMLTPVFTSRATLKMEASITRSVRDGASDHRHRLDPALIAKRFDALEAELRTKLGVNVSLDEQRAAALHVASQTGNHAFVEGWAGTGKTTLLRATAEAYKEAGFEVIGCCQSASAAQNLARETDVPSRTIASLLLAIQSGRATLDERTIVFLDEAGMVGSREFALVQNAALAANAKLVAVGDSKQLQPIEAGGIFRALVREHGAAEISSIRRQRTNFDPLFEWLETRSRKSSPNAMEAAVATRRIDTLRSLPDEAKMRAAEAFCSTDNKLHRGFLKWRARFDHEWLRDAVESFAIGAALPALRLLDAHGRLRFSEGPLAATESLLDAWAADKTPLALKTMIAATRAEVAELNAQARERLVAFGVVRDDAGLDIEIKHRDETTEWKRFAPGDRIVFTQNDRDIGVANGSIGTIRKIRRAAGGQALVVSLDDANERGETIVRAPVSFGRFDLAYCLTNHKMQGRTLDSAHVLVTMADREWIYVAASRSRFATTLYVDGSSIAAADPESHLPQEQTQDRDRAIEALALRMSRSRAKGTTLDYRSPSQNASRLPQDRSPLSPDAKAKVLRSMGRAPERANEQEREHAVGR